MDSPVRLIAGLALLALPLLELALLIKLGQAIGFWPVILLVVATAVLGFYIIRTQGFATFERVGAALEAGHEPHKALADGMFLLFAGILLVLPGPLSDLLGLLLLVPPVRRLLSATLFSRGVVMSRWSTRSTARRPPPEDFDRRPQPDIFHGGRREGGEIIEGEFERIDEKPIEPRQTKPAPPDAPRRP